MKWTGVHNLDGCDSWIVGVAKHQNQLPWWEAFVEKTALPLDEWLASDVIDVTFGAVTIIPSRTKRYVFVGLGERKRMTIASLNPLWKKIGVLTQQQYAQIGIMIRSFESPNVSANELVAHALPRIQYEAILPVHYKTSSNKADVWLEELFVEGVERERLDDCFKCMKWLKQWKRWQQEPVNARSIERFFQETIPYVEQCDATYKRIQMAQLIESGFGALLNSFEKVEIGLFTSTNRPIATIVCAVDLEDSGDVLYSALSQMMHYPIRLIVAIGEKKKALREGMIVTSISGKTIEFGRNANWRDVASFDLLAFATMQQAKRVLSVAPLAQSSREAFGSNQLVIFSKRQGYTDQGIWLQTIERDVSQRADVFVETPQEGKVYYRNKMLSMFSPQHWVHVESNKEFMTQCEELSQIVMKENQQQFK